MALLIKLQLLRGAIGKNIYFITRRDICYIQHEFYGNKNNTRNKALYLVQQHYSTAFYRIKSYNKTYYIWSQTIDYVPPLHNSKEI